MEGNRLQMQTDEGGRAFFFCSKKRRGNETTPLIQSDCECKCEVTPARENRKNALGRVVQPQHGGAASTKVAFGRGDGFVWGVAVEYGAVDARKGNGGEVQGGSRWGGAKTDWMCS